MMRPLTIQVLGEFIVLRNGAVVRLSSKKTRALLAYLAVVGRPQRRDRLCDMFWEVPDDPRGALRWSLSKIRQVVDDDGTKRLNAGDALVEGQRIVVGIDAAKRERSAAKRLIGAL